MPTCHVLTFFGVSRPIIPLLTQAWVSDVVGVPSSSPIQKALNLSNNFGFPTSVALHRWSLGFRQFSVHHRIQLLRTPLGYPTSPHAAFPTGCASPWGFPSFRVSGMSSGAYGNFPWLFKRAMYCAVKWRTLRCKAIVSD